MTIPALPAAPALGDSPEVFNTKAFAFVAALDDWGAAANATAVAVDADAAAADADAATATTQAGIATTKAGEATTAAGTATTKAGEAATSANLADASAAAAALSEAAAAGYAASIDPATIVRLSGNQTIAGVKTFSSTPVVPDGSFTYAKMQSVTAGKVLGRDTSGAGVVQELPIAVGSSGNVGIGTSAPTTKLTVNNDTDNSTVAIFHAGGGTPNRGLKVSTFSSINANAGVLLDAQTTAGGAALAFGTAGTEQGRFDSSGNFKFNSGYGSVATAYACRAWVNFNGTGAVEIRASGNVTSITDNGTGNFTVNFTNAMPDANFSTVGSTARSLNATAAEIMLNNYGFSTTGTSVETQNGGGTNVDPAVCCISIFR